jgi:anthranilate phosphoribosyltransferase
MLNCLTHGVWLADAGLPRSYVVHGLDGLDEISTVGKTLIAHLKDSTVRIREYSPSDFGLKPAMPRDLQCSSAEESAQTIFRILNGKDETAKPDIVLVNAAAGIIVGGKASDFKDAMALAQKSISSGAAYGKLKSLVKASGGNLSKLEEHEAQ